MHDRADVMLRDEIKRSSERIGPITVAEVLARPLVDAEAEADEVHSDVAVFDLRQGDRSARSDDGATQTSPRRRRMITVTIAAAIVLVAGVVFIDGGKQGVVVTDATSSPGVTEPAAPPAVADPGSSPWTLVFHDQAGFGGDGESEMTGVVAGGPGLVRWIPPAALEPCWS